MPEDVNRLALDGFSRNEIVSEFEISFYDLYDFFVFFDINSSRQAMRVYRINTRNSFKVYS